MRRNGFFLREAVRKIAAVITVSLLVGCVAPASEKGNYVVYAGTEDTRIVSEKPSALAVDMSDVSGMSGEKLAEAQKPIEEVKTVSTRALVQGETTSIKGDSYAVEFRVDSVWDRHGTISVTVTNTGETTMEDWSFLYEQPGEITQIWNAQIVAQETDGERIACLDWNKDIAVGESVAFGYIVQGDALALPSEITYTGAFAKQPENVTGQENTVIVKGEDFFAEFEIESAWNNHCTVNVTLTNTGERTMENWAITYEQQGEIIQIWNAQITSQNGNKYAIENLGWNQRIEVGESISFGYIVEGEDLKLPSTVTYTGDRETEFTPIQGKVVTVQGQGFVVEFKVDSAWEEQCIVNATITNTGSLAMKNWAISYEQSGEIIQIWDAKVVSRDGKRYTIENFGWVMGIDVGESASFGYILEGENLELPSVVIYTGEYVTEETVIPTPTIKPTPEPTVTPTPTNTPTPEPTVTPIPTNTPTPEPTVTLIPTSTPTPEVSKRQISLTVSTQDSHTVFLAWDVPDVTTSYEVLVDNVVVGCVSGSGLSYRLPDDYAEYTYQVRSIGTEELEESNEFHYTNIKRVCGTLLEDTLWGGEHVGSYYVTNDVIIPTGITLRIMPGTFIRFASGTGLFVEGTLLAEGIEGNRVVMISEDEVGNSGNSISTDPFLILIHGTARFSHTQVEENSGDAIGVMGTAEVYIGQSEIVGAGTAVHTTAKSGKMVIEESTLYGSTAEAAIVQHGGDAEVLIRNCLVESIGSAALYINSSSDSQLCLDGNVVSGTGSVSIFSVGQGLFSVENNTFMCAENIRCLVYIDLGGVSCDHILEIQQKNMFQGEKYTENIGIGGVVNSVLELPSGTFLFYEIYVAKGGRIIVPAGTTFLATEDAYIYVEGELYFAGTEQNRIEITCCEDSQTEMWKGINVAEEGVFDARHTLIRDAAGPDYYFILDEITTETLGGINISGEATFNNCEVVTEEDRNTLVAIVVNENGTLVFQDSQSIGGMVGFIIKSKVGSVKIENSIIKAIFEALYIKQSGTASINVKNNEIKGGGFNPVKIESLGTGDFELIENMIEGGNYPITVNLEGLHGTNPFPRMYKNEYINPSSFKGIRICGCVNEEIELTEGEYCTHYENELSVGENGKLVINAGVRLIPYYGRPIEVYGEMNICGTEEQPVELGNDDYWMWCGIIVWEGGKLQAEHLKINYSYGQGVDYGEFGSTAMITVFGSATFKHCELNPYSAGYCFAVLEQGNLNVEKSCIDAYYNILYHEANSGKVILKENIMKGPVKFANFLLDGTASVSIHENDIEIMDSTSRGISLEGGDGNDFELINNNIIAGGDTTLWVKSIGTIKVVGNTMTGNYGGAWSAISIPSSKLKWFTDFGKTNTAYNYQYTNGVRVQPGELNEDIVLEEGEYMLDNVQIAEGTKITIESGSEIHIDGKLTVNGEVHFDGCDEKAIEAISMSEGYIYVGETGTFVATNTVFDQGLYGIKFDGRRLLLKNCTINALDSAMVVTTSDGEVTVEESNLSSEYDNCYGVDIRNSGSGNILFDKSTITGGGYGMYLRGNNIEVLSCIITGSSWYGVNIATDTIVFRDNQIMYAGYSPMYIEIDFFKNKLIEDINTNSFSGHQYGDYIAFYGTVADADIVLPKGTYLCTDYISVGAGKTLTIEPGTVLLCDRSITVSNGGVINALGTKEEPIVFTSLYDSRYSDYTVENPMWRGIIVSGSNAAQRFPGEYRGEYNVISYADRVSTYGILTLRNSVIENSPTYGIYADTISVPQINYCTFRNNAVAIKNVNEDVVVNATCNSWNSDAGPARYTEIIEDSGSTFKWVGDGEKIEGNIDYGGYEGEEAIILGKVGEQEGTNAATGDYNRVETDLSYNYLDGTMDFVRTYSLNRRTQESIFGRGWSFNYACKIYKAPKDDSTVYVQLPDGSEESFKTELDIVYTAKNTRSNLMRDLEGQYILYTQDRTQYTYNADGYLYKIVDECGNTITISLDDSGRPTKITDCVGRVTTLKYEGNRLVSMTDPAERTVRYTYNKYGQLENVIDANGNKTTYVFTTKPDDGLTEIIGYEGDISYTIEKIDYLLKNEQYRVESITDANGNKKEYTYDEKNGITVITNSDGTTEKQSYDSLYNIVKSVDGCNNVTNYAYYLDENNTSKYGELQWQRDAYGKWTFYERDARGNVTKIQHPDGGEEIFDYDARNHCIYYKDQVGVVTRYEYSDDGLLLREIVELDSDVSYSENASPTKFAITTYAYYGEGETTCKAKGLVKSIISPEGSETTFTYDKYGNKESITDAKGNTVTYTYDSIGRVTKQTTALGYKTSLQYDAAGNVTKRTLHEGETTQTWYNRFNLPTKMITAEGSETACYRYEYDTAGNIKKMIDPFGNVTTYDYDIFGNIKTEVLPLGAVYHYTYDANQRVIKVEVQEDKAAEKHVLKKFEYEITGGKLKVEETVDTGSGRWVTTYFYDEKDRLVEQRNPDGGTVTYHYRKDGLSDYETDALNQTTYYQYDAQKNCIGVWTPCVNGGHTYQGMVYDRDGNLLEQIQGVTPVVNGAVPEQVIRIKYVYDRVGNVESMTDGNNTKTTFVYDKDGRCISEEVQISETQTSLKKYAYGHFGEPVSMSVFTEAESFNGSETGLVELKTVYEYDAEGRRIKETAPDKVVTEYGYDAAGNCDRITVTGTDGEYKTERRQYNALGKVTYEEDAKGNKTYYEYDGFGNLVKIKDALDGVTLYEYDYVGNRTAEVLPRNYVAGKTIYYMSRLEYSYDAFGRVRTVIEDVCEKNDSRSVQIAYYTYDRNGNRLTEADVRGNTVTYTYTPAGKVATIQTAESAAAGKAFSVRYTYDALGRVLTEENALGGIITYTYDAADNVCTVTKGEAVAEYEYDGVGNLLSEKDVNGKVTTYTYNTMGLPLSLYTMQADGMDSYREVYRYDKAGRLIFTETSTGTRVKTEYDDFGNVTSQGTSGTDGWQYREENYTYDKNGNVETYTNAENVTVTYVYDALDRIVSESMTVSGNEQQKKTGYDANGNITSETDIFGNITTYRYDAFNRLTYVISPENKILASYTYDYAGNLESETDALRHVTTYKYNEANRVRETTDGEGNVTTTTYDALGNVKSIKDGEGNTTTYVYDEYGNLRSVTTEDEIVTEYTYDVAGNLKTQTDGAGHKTEYYYNQAGLVIRRVEDGTVVVTYTYNGDESVASMTDANGTKTTYTYNPHGELISEIATSAEGDKSVYTYSYDRAGNLSSMTDESGTTTYTYDEWGRVLTKDAPNFTTVRHVYDLNIGMDAGWHYVLQEDGFGSTRTVYDTLNREVKVTSERIGGEKESAEIVYYANGARKQVTFADGSVEEYTFYGNGLVKSVTNKLPDGTIQDCFTYVYDKAGNQISKTEVVNGVERGTTAYTYDEQNRLKSVTEPDGTTTTYEYDGAGNRKKEIILSADGTETVNTYSYNGRNHLLSVEKSKNGATVSKTEYTYDANGNQLTETVTSGSTKTKVLSNTYDLRNQLVRSETRDAVINNTYNAAGYRVGKSVTKGGKTEKTYFLYDGGSVIMEADGSGTVTAKNTYAGPLLFRTVLADEEETTYEYMYNAHGDVVTLLSDGEVKATYYYDAFGNIKEQTGAVDNSIRYAGYQYDEETGLYYLNARMYDPVTARFLQADTYLGNLNDPLSLNLYTYCLNNPNKYIDPSGHVAITALLTFIAGRIVVGAIAGGVAAGMEILNQKFIEKRTRVDYDLVWFEALSNGSIAAFTSGIAAWGGFMAKQTGKTVVRTAGKKLGRQLLYGAAFGFAEGMVNDIGRQFIMGTHREDISYSQATGAGIIGSLFGAGGVGIEYGIDALKNTRMISNLRNSARGKLGYYANIMKGKFDDVAGKASKVVELEGVETSYGKSSSNIVNKHKGWKVGDPIDNLTKAGKKPSWSTVKARYWKNEAYYNPDMYSSKNLDLMGKGKAPRHNMIDVPQELHHINGRNIDNPHNIDNLMPAWPWEHAEIDPYRYYKGPRP